jgi:hypothetical protein
MILEGNKSLLNTTVFPYSFPMYELEKYYILYLFNTWLVLQNSHGTEMS